MACHRKLPVFSSRHNKTPLSPVILGSRGFSLFVPTKIRPPANTGPAHDREPQVWTHLMFFAEPSSMLHSVATFFSTMLTGFRLGLPKNVGQERVSPAFSSTAAGVAAFGVTPTATASLWVALGFGSSSGAFTLPVGEHEIMRARAVPQAASAVVMEVLLWWPGYGMCRCSS